VHLANARALALLAVLAWGAPAAEDAAAPAVPVPPAFPPHLTFDEALRDGRAQLAFLLGARGEVPEFEVDAPELARSAAPAALSCATATSLLARARFPWGR